MVLSEAAPSVGAVGRTGSTSVTGWQPADNVVEITYCMTVGYLVLGKGNIINNVKQLKTGCNTHGRLRLNVTNGMCISRRSIRPRGARDVFAALSRFDEYWG
jgi:hypothetical protein